MLGDDVEARESGNLFHCLLNQIFRHGARTPADTFPNDPHINETFSPFGWGQLTNVSSTSIESHHLTSLPLQKGKAQLFETGSYLRKRYSDFLDGTFMPEVNHLKSKSDFEPKLIPSDTPRAIYWGDTNQDVPSASSCWSLSTKKHST
jgi:hypothetical protein